MNGQADVTNEIEQITLQYINLPRPELEERLIREWHSAGIAGKVPIRSTSRFWKDVVKRLVRKIIIRLGKNRDPAMVTIGLIAGQVLIWAQSIGIDVSLYRVPIALLVAIVAQSIWDLLEEGQSITST